MIKLVQSGASPSSNTPPLDPLMASRRRWQAGSTASTRMASEPNHTAKSGIRGSVLSKSPSRRLMAVPKLCGTV